MAWRTIQTDTQYYTESELLGILNDNSGTSHLSLGAAIAAGGLVAAAAIINPRLHPKIAQAIAAASAVLTYATMLNTLDEYFSDTTVQEGITKMQQGGGSVLIVTTRLQEWSSGSGNHHTWRTVHSTSYSS